jgi:predicted regulator of Ras-like GTPase activity (Roadblock/LC7/MglB family)
MSKMTQLDDMLQQMLNEMPGAILAGIVGRDGTVVSAYPKNPGVDVETCGAMFPIVMQVGEKLCQHLKDELLDNLVTIDDAYLLTTALGDGSYYVGLVASRQVATLGNVRLIARQYKQELYDIITKQ